MNLKSIVKNGSVLTLGLAFFVGATVSAAPNSQMNQKINAGPRTIDIVDTTNSDAPVANPAVQFTDQTFSFTDQTSPGILGTAAEMLRVSNASGNEAWAVTIAASAPTDLWDDTVSTYDFNDPAVGGGQLTIDPTSGTLATVTGSCGTAGITQPAAAAFDEGVNDSITLLQAASDAKHCEWDFSGINFSQNIPGGTPESGASDYALDLVLTIS